MTKYLPINAELLSVDSNENPVEGWKLSRPNLNHDNLTKMDVYSIDLPVNELTSITLQIQAPLFIRDLLALNREHRMWATTSRNYDFTKDASYNIVTGFEKYTTYYDAEYEGMMRMKAEGVHQDIYRLRTPITSICWFTLALSFRTWIKVLKEVRTIKPTLTQTKHVLEMFEDTMIQVLANAMKLSSSEIEVLINKYGPAPQLAPVANSTSGVVSDDNFMSVTTTGSFSLFSQLIRHRNLLITSSLKSIIESEELPVWSQESPITFNAVGTRSMWSRVLSKRLCWIADPNLWSPVIEAAGAGCTESDLPCNGDGTKCPNHGDAVARFTDDDPGYPCPIHANSNNMNVLPKYEEGMRNELATRPVFWLEHINKVNFGN